MRYQGRSDFEWRKTFAVFPVPLFGEDQEGKGGRRAWLESIEVRFQETITGRLRVLYRPIGSDWDWYPTSGGSYKPPPPR